MEGYRPRVTARESFDIIVEISDDDSDVFTRLYGTNSDNVKLLAILWSSLLADTPLFNVSGSKPRNIVRKFYCTLRDDTLGVISRFSSLYDDLTHSVVRVDGQATISHFIVEFKDTPIFKEYLEFYKTGAPHLFKYISSFLLFGKKSYYEDQTFDQTAFRGWLDVEERLSDINFDRGMMGSLREIIAWMFRTFDDELVLPKNGGGAVAERGIKTVIQKLENIRPTLEQLALFYRPEQEIQPDALDLYPGVYENLPGSARLKFVPKDIGKSRSICMEPVTTQYYQQAVRLWVEQALDTTMRSHIPLHEQHRNRYLARRGSVNGRLDTIDLSSASDSVHVNFVEAVFESDLKSYLLSTRSSEVEYDQSGEGTMRVRIHKFAPMGSALCFPIQSALYTAIVLYSSLVVLFNETVGNDLHLNRRAMYHYYALLKEKGYEPFSVYGDDIICDKRVTPTVIETLTQLGFVVNQGKSFLGLSTFRESCGGYYLNGTDVTPLRAKFKKVSNTMSLQTLAGLIDMANRAYDYGYLSLRQHIIRICLHYPLADRTGQFKADGRVNEILFTDGPDASFAIFTSNPDNTHLKRRYFRFGVQGKTTADRFQRSEFRSLHYRVTDVDTYSSGDDWYRHQLWWRSHYASSVEDIEVPSKIPARAGLAWRWTSQAGD